MAIIIPARKYLTYGELRERWQCSDNDLRYLIVAEELKPSVKAFKSFTIPSWSFDDDVFDEVIAEGEQYDGQNGCAIEVKPSGWLFLQDPKQTGPLACEFFLVSHERNPDKPTEPWGTPLALWFWLPYPMTIDLIVNEAVFMMDEVCRYEAAHDKDAGPEQIEKDRPLGTTERNNLLKLVIGMAVKGYSHDPAALKSTASKEIADDLAALGVSITDETVRKYLKQAASVLPAKPMQT